MAKIDPINQSAINEIRLKTRGGQLEQRACLRSSYTIFFEQLFNVTSEFWR